jgi:hypothetical protein
MENKNSQEYKLFSRLVALSKKYNESDKTTLWNQWDLKDHLYVDIINDEETDKINDWNTHDFHNEDNFQIMICLCSHSPIKRLNLMENRYTGERCIIGSCCIKKFSTDELKKDMKIKIGKKEGKRYCKGCGIKLRNNTPTWKTYHKTCFKKFGGCGDYESDNDSESDDEHEPFKVHNPKHSDKPKEQIMDNPMNKQQIKCCQVCKKPLPTEYEPWKTYHKLCYRQYKIDKEIEEIDFIDD